MALVWERLSCDGQGSFCTRFIRGFAFAGCVPKKKEKILSNLSGSFNFGELTALMGPSGSGKSTLLKCLTEGKNYPGVKGRIAVGTETKARVCFITQNDRDHLLPSLTVAEALLYASQMKNPSNFSKAQHIEIVDDLVDELDLMKAKNTKIDKCSGGQKKKIVIALELTAKNKPNFLFLDEPTSGLDSYSGFNVVHRLRELAIRRGIAIVTVIHQPSYEILSKFHNVYVLSKVGSCVFSGTPMELQQVLIDHRYITTTSPHTNPADIIITIASSVSKDNELETNLDVESTNNSITTATIKSLHKTKTDCENMTRELAENWHTTPMAGLGRRIDGQGLCSFSVNFRMYTLWVLFKRACVTSIWRQKQLIFIRMALHAVVVAILAALYNRNVGEDSGCISTEPHAAAVAMLTALYNRSIAENGDCISTESHNVILNCSTFNISYNETIPEQNVKFQFFSLMFLMFAALMPTVLTFSSEIKLFVNEHRNRWYSTSSYYISKTLVEVPCQILFPFCYVYFLCWYSQQYEMNSGFTWFMSWRFAYFLGVTILCCFIAQGLGFLIGILCVHSFSMAIILSSSVLLFLFLFSGFFVKISVMSSYTGWITYLSFIRFGFESLLIIIYGKGRCDSIEKSITLDSFNLNDEDLITNLYLLLAHLISIRIIAYFLLRNLADRKFMKLPRSCPFVFEKTLPWYREARLKVGEMTFILIRLGLVLFVIHIIVGIILLIHKVNKKV